MITGNKRLSSSHCKANGGAKVGNCLNRVITKPDSLCTTVSKILELKLGNSAFSLIHKNELDTMLLDH